MSLFDEMEKLEEIKYYANQVSITVIIPKLYIKQTYK